MCVCVCVCAVQFPLYSHFNNGGGFVIREGRSDDILQEVRVCVCALCNFPFTPTSTTVEALPYTEEEGMTSPKRNVCVCVLCNFPFNLASTMVEGLPYTEEEGMTSP